LNAGYGFIESLGEQDFNCTVRSGLHSVCTGLPMCVFAVLWRSVLAAVAIVTRWCSLALTHRELLLICVHACNGRAICAAWRTRLPTPEARCVIRLSPHVPRALSAEAGFVACADRLWIVGCWLLSVIAVVACECVCHVHVRAAHSSAIRSRFTSSAQSCAIASHGASGVASMRSLWRRGRATCSSCTPPSGAAAELSLSSLLLASDSPRFACAAVCSARSCARQLRLTGRVLRRVRGLCSRCMRYQPSRTATALCFDPLLPASAFLVRTPAHSASRVALWLTRAAVSFCL
jgi:hypothetical protein